MSDPAPPATTPHDRAGRRVVIVNKRGLHARAAAGFARLAETFAADVTVTGNGLTVPGRSIMGLMMLAAGPGTEIEITARGADVAATLDALVALVEKGFNEK